MMTSIKRISAIYVDRTIQQWVVRDIDGNFWSLPPTEHPWDDREPFHPTEESDLEPVPGHYRYMLDLPF